LKIIRNISFYRASICLVGLLLLTIVAAIVVVNVSNDTHRNEAILAVENQVTQPSILGLLLTYMQGGQSRAAAVGPKTDRYLENLELLKEGGQSANGEGPAYVAATGDARSAIDKALRKGKEMKASLAAFWDIIPSIDSVFYERQFVVNSTDTGVFIDTIDVQRTVQESNYLLEIAYRNLIKQSKTLTEIDGQITVAYLTNMEGSKARQEFWLYSLGAFASLLAAALVWLLIVGFVRPVRQLSRRLEEISGGDYTHLVAVRGKSELGRLGVTMRALMVKSRKVSEFVEAFRNGDVDYRESTFETEPQYQNDRFIKDLIETQSKLKITAEGHERRLWINAGFAKFGDILQGVSSGIKDLSSKIATSLSTHLDVDQGAVYIAFGEDENDVHLQLLGSFAYGRTRFTERRIAAGEGLLGGAFLERKSTNLTEIPDGHVLVEPDAENDIPTSVLVVPLNSGDDCIGLIELVSVKPFTEEEIDFVGKLAGQIAATVAKVRANDRTRALYEESQTQSKQMQSQEEEMRQNLEELHAAQEEMARKEQESLRRIAELEAKLGGK
jgi:putative methionine-R-sulfoxide reductase with GAF domain